MLHQHADFHYTQTLQPGNTHRTGPCASPATQVTLLPSPTTCQTQEKPKDEAQDTNSVLKEPTACQAQCQPERILRTGLGSACRPQPDSSSGPPAPPPLPLRPVETSPKAAPHISTSSPGLALSSTPADPRLPGQYTDVQQVPYSHPVQDPPPNISRASGAPQVSPPAFPSSSHRPRHFKCHSTHGWPSHFPPPQPSCPDLQRH